MRLFIVVFTVFGLSKCGNNDGAAQTPALAQQEGVEVLAQGSDDEAFAGVADVTVKSPPIVPKQPPKPVEEMPPDQKLDDPNVQWIPGYWAWEEYRSDFIWISGVWRVPPPIAIGFRAIGSR
jgi:hypothetical protein